jgi:hypothetical protein
LSDLKKSEGVMKPRTDAAESRRLGNVELDKAGRLPDGKKKDAHRHKAQAYEDSAHSSEWCDSGLQKPD